MAGGAVTGIITLGGFLMIAAEWKGKIEQKVVTQERRQEIMDTQLAAMPDIYLTRREYNSLVERVDRMMTSQNKQGKKIDRTLELLVEINRTVSRRD